ncbi:MAG: sigma 54-interacting transcriptional regulator, partial [Candidatus Zixiibacteriota bacterium]
MIKSRYELAVTRYLAAKSGIYDDGERSAMLYLAREYFQSEDVHKFVEKIDRELNARPKVEIRNKKTDNDAPVFIAASPKMKKIVELAENVAQSDLNILLTGPTGAGKDQLAKYIHYCSGRKGEFVTVNSAAIPDSMVESELFGYRKGAFTGAEWDNPGLMVEADGGTFYLNEIADAANQLQAKLLEVIENKTIRPLGGGAKKKINIRIIAATNHNLTKRIAENKFRLDLFHRLNVVPIDLPPLSERLEDIPVLVKHFLDHHHIDININGDSKRFDDFCRFLSMQIWTGNVRELRSRLDHLCITSGYNFERMLNIIALGNFGDKDKLQAVLDMAGGSRRKAASILGITEGGVRYRMKKYGIEPDESA